MNSEKSILLTNGTVFDGVSNILKNNIFIYIERDKIVKISSKLPAVSTTTKVIDVTDYTILPGLIDAHVHFKNYASKLFLQFGVTTVRDVGSDPDWIIQLREQEKRGDNSLPRIVAYGPLLDGIPPYWGTEWKGSVGLHTIEETREVVNSLITKGVDGLKVYAGLPLELIKEVIGIAKKHNLPVTADLSTHQKNVLAKDAIKAGITSLEHVSGVWFPLSNDEQNELINLIIENDVYVIPTLIVLHNQAYIKEIGNKNYPNLDMMPSDVRKRFLNWKTKDENWYTWRKKTNKLRDKFILKLYRAEGKIVSGSDTANPFVIPGFGLHQELERLVSIGIPPAGVLKSATSLAAKLLHKTDVGVIEEGRHADLLIIKGNPIENISATQNIQIVIKAGQIVFQHSGK